MTAPSYRATLTTYLRPLRGKVATLAVTLLASIGLQLYVPQLLARFIDEAITESAAVSALIAIGIAYLIAGLINQVLDAISSYLGTDVGWIATNRLREDLSRHLLALDMGYHNDTTPGEMIERVDGDVTAVSDFISRFLVRLLGAAVLLGGVLVVSWLTDFRMGLALTLYVIGGAGVAVELAQPPDQSRRGGAGGFRQPVRIHRGASGGDRRHTLAWGGAIHDGALCPGHGELLPSHHSCLAQAGHCLGHSQHRVLGR